MTPSAPVIEREGWHLTLAEAASDLMAERREQLVTLALAAARGTAGPALRRTRTARTFRVSLGKGPPREIFIKLLEWPRGLKRLKTMMRGPRSLHVARVTAALGAAGLIAPPVLLYGNEPASGREILLTAWAEGEGPFKALDRVIAHKRATLRALGAEVARLHRAGFVHGDLTPFNLFVVFGEPRRFIFVDHERTRRTLIVGRRRRQLRNLVQLGRFGLPGLTRTDRMRVLQAYAGGLGRPAWLRLRRRAAAMLARRVARDGLEPAKRPARLFEFGGG
jgi:hypothetical protein